MRKAKEHRSKVNYLYHIILETPEETKQISTRGSRNKTRALQRCYNESISWLGNNGFINANIIKTSAGCAIYDTNDDPIAQVYVNDMEM